jgi:hypothetical protein
MNKTGSIYASSTIAGSIIIVMSLFFLVLNPNHEDDWWVNVGIMIVGFIFLVFGLIVRQKYYRNNSERTYKTPLPPQSRMS